MKNHLKSFQVLFLGGHPELLLVAGIMAVLSMMIVPLPSGLLDFMLATNIVFSGLVLVAVLFSVKPLALSTFPSILLISTLFRLSLNVSSTRLILSEGSAGEVVTGFGHFVVGGRLVVGVVMFVVIVIVQFLVIGKGAERVAEVGARFTLDAMPGRQMSIDADLRSGAIDDETARALRAELGTESQFYGAMDGAMKFVKGDAIAGLIITALNMVAGLVVGVVEMGLPLAEALQIYTLLTIGDGLVSQVPTLLITLAAGILTTRVAARDERNDLARSLNGELISSPKTLWVGATLAGLLGLVPGLPVLPFAIVGAILATVGFTLSARQARLEVGETTDCSVSSQPEKPFGSRPKGEPNVDAPVPAISILLSPALSPILLPPGGPDKDSEILGQLIPQLREAISIDSGVVVPAVTIQTYSANVPPDGFSIALREIPVFSGRVAPDKILVVESAARLGRLQIPAEPTTHPANGGVASLVDAKYQAHLANLELSTWSPAGIIVLHLAAVLREHLRSLVGLQEVSDRLEQLAKQCPKLVAETVPKVVSLSLLTDVLRRLTDEGISIRDLKTILEALQAFGQFETEPVTLTEYVRAEMGLQIGYTYAGPSGRLNAVTLDPEIEDTIHSAITRTHSGYCLSLDPEVRQELLGMLRGTLEPIFRGGLRPVILTNPEIRRYVRRLLEDELPAVPVLSYEELPPKLLVRTLVQVKLGRGLLAA